MYNLFVKRANGLGSVYQNSRGQWVAQVSIPGTPRRYLRRIAYSEEAATALLATLPLRPVDQVARFWSFVARRGEGDCWLWLGGRNRLGYGIFGIGHKYNAAYRFAYEFAVGPIPTGLEIDHLCRNRGCVNPAHLEPVTHAENVRRGMRARAA